MNIFLKNKSACYALELALIAIKLLKKKITDKYHKLGR